MSLEQKSKKIKYFFQLLVLIEILVFLYFVYQINSFEQNRPAVQINHDAFAINFDKKSPLESSEIRQGIQQEGKIDQIAASKNGSKYYFPNCSGLNRIKVENLVYFTSENEAKSAGYELAKNCEK